MERNLKMRKEHDFLGEKLVPDEVYYGVQTMRAKENFQITGAHLDPDFIKSMASVKKASCLTNLKTGRMDKTIGEAIIQAADEIMDGKMLDQFPLDPIQGGAGTSINMNMNEVLCNRALEILGYEKGRYDIISPNNHANMAQSTNDVFPTSIKVCLCQKAVALTDALERLAEGCTGVKRTTGQHPGGIIVLPLGEEINSFTPVQHPANDMTTDIVTTHFDYHSIDHNLLKLDILGHDDPTMIKTLEEYISSPAMDNEYNETDNRFDATKIPLDDQGVISLFHDTSALGIKPDDIGGCPVGCLGIPEFGTDFVIQMVVDTKPNTISDLIRISGLSHGTDVWLNNAQELIRSGKATISTAICTRDDIMTYLINKGMDSEESFTIMERVRKGTVAKGKCKEWPEFKKDMAEHNVPDWYVWSCEQIKYMFPKAHAAAYVMMAYRIAYCKINYPLAYYGAYFGIRADAFSYEIMCQGKEKLQYYIDDYNRRSATLSKKEQDTMKDMKIVQEMYARGFEFEPLDIYKAQATKFLIVNGKLMPPLSSIDGMGEKAAEAVAEASKDGTYLSLDDFRQRTKASKTVIDTMVDLGILADLPASNQLSLFDF